MFSALSAQCNVTGTYFSRPSEDLVSLDTTDREQVASLFKRRRIDLVLDCGGITRPDLCEQDRSRAFRTNVDGVRNVADFCNCKTVYFSTDYVFDGEKGHYSEYDQINPINYYGWTKSEAEKIVLGTDQGNVVIRVAGLYGLSPRNNEFLSALQVPIVHKATDCLSSSLLLDDLVRHFPYFLAGSGLYHLSDGKAISRFEFTSRAVHVLGLPTEVVGESAEEIYPMARRPRNSSIISARHNLKVCGLEIGFRYIRRCLSVRGI